MVFAQKGVTPQSRLNIGQQPKKVVNQSGLTKTNLPKQLNINTKNNYTQFYRDLIIVSKTKETVSSANSSTNENIQDNAKLSNVYPNPADLYTNLDYSINSDFNAASISFYNLLGKSVFEISLNKSSEKLRVNTSNWESGIYMYQLVIDGKKISTKKLLVRHN